MTLSWKQTRDAWLAEVHDALDRGEHAGHIWDADDELWWALFKRAQGDLRASQDERLRYTLLARKRDANK
jgi:hypothetical protein